MARAHHVHILTKRPAITLWSKGTSLDTFRGTNKISHLKLVRCQRGRGFVQTTPNHRRVVWGHIRGGHLGGRMNPGVVSLHKVRQSFQVLGGVVSGDILVSEFFQSRLNRSTTAALGSPRVE